MKILANQKERAAQEGLTLLEILVSVTLLVAIVFGLMAMFNQTEKAFRSGLTNVDLLEGGRSAMEMVSRDLEQTVAINQTNLVNFYARTNVQGGLNLTFNGKAHPTTLQRVYCVTHPGDWQGVGFQVLNPSDPNSLDTVLVGSLFKFSTNATQLGGNSFLNTFNDLPQNLITNRAMNRVIDGVVHFSTRLYDAQGREITVLNNTNSDVTFGKSRDIYFSRAELPAYIEVELGLVEGPTAEHVRAMPNPAAASAFLNQHTEKIHFFRQHIPIRTARK